MSRPGLLFSELSRTLRAILASHSVFLFQALGTAVLGGGLDPAFVT